MQGNQGMEVEGNIQSGHPRGQTSIIDNIFKIRKDLDNIQDAVYPTFQEYKVSDPEVVAWAKISAGLRGMGVDPGGPLPEQDVLMAAASKVGLDDVGVSDWKKVENALLELSYKFPKIVNQISEFIKILELAQAGGGTRKPSKRRKSSRRKSSRRKSYKKRNTKKKKTKRRRRRTKRR